MDVIHTSIPKSSYWPSFFRGFIGEFSGKFMPMPMFVHPRPLTTYFTADMIMSAVCQHYKILKQDLVGPRRMFALSHPRQMAMHLCKQRCPHLSYPQIGRIFGNRDHSTVIHAIKVVNKRLEEEPEVVRQYRHIERRLRRLEGVA